LIDLVGKRYWFFLFSALIIIPGLISLALPPGLRLGVDFTGGTLWEQRFPVPVQPAEIKQILADNGFDAIVQSIDQSSVVIRMKELRIDSPEKAQIEAAFKAAYGTIPTADRYDTVGPTVGAEVASRASVAVALASIGILLYLWYAFRRLHSAWKYGACAIVALLHDVLVVLGVSSILGRLLNLEVDAMFVTALLTIIGFSVHDTIVVFDRIRENSIRHSGESIGSIVNHSLLQTLGRSLATSLTVIFTLSALVLFGGVTTRTFAMTLLIGIISGTYSSIFNASQLLVIWENGELARLFGQRARVGRAVS
jgi:preprotein translocase subunit SecF